MSDNERDTKFQGFAKLLRDEIEAKVHTTYDFIPEGERLRRDFIPVMHTIIAQRAYDLAYHVLLQVDLDDDYYSRFEYDTKRIVNSIPDLIQWPESPDSE